MPPFDPVEFCKAAHKVSVVKQALDGEVAWRTATTRAYYAVWVATRDAIRAKQGDPNLDPGHKPLWDKLKEPANTSEIQELGEDGAVLMKWRHVSDYDMGVPVTEDVAKKRAAQCHAFLKSLQRLQDALPVVQHYAHR